MKQAILCSLILSILGHIANASNYNMPFARALSVFGVDLFTCKNPTTLTDFSAANLLGKQFY